MKRNTPRSDIGKTSTTIVMRPLSYVFVDRIALTLLAILTTFLILAIFNPERAVHANNAEANQPAVDEKTTLVEQALFTRAEFFGSQAIVPYPTAEARQRLAALQAKYANDPQIELKLSQLDEKLGREADALAELRAFAEHEPDKTRAFETMAAFFGRRAQFAEQTATLAELLKTAPPDRRVEIFARIIELARNHLLTQYLTPAFYEETLAQNPSAFEIIEQYLQKLVDEKSYPEALKLVRQYRDRVPDRRAFLIEREATILDEMGLPKQAEAVYAKTFDPFWPAELSDQFYQFLRDHDRFRSYGRELREAFRRNPTDFDTAVKLLHYTKQNYDESPDVFVQLEKARAARKIGWQPEELITITRLLLADGYAEAASRFLYTLYLQGELKPGSALRAKVLYQLFELLADAKQEKMSLTRGDLKFYQDIATADPHPGMLGGILSLVLSDTNPRQEFQEETKRAGKYFNRAAAYRIFTAYKQEYPTAPELAQMYLDVVRFYTATKDTAVAAETLAEFEKRYGPPQYTDAPQYPEVALKLADAYVAVGKPREEQAVYQRILDYLGQRRKSGVRLVSSSAQPQAASGSDSQTTALSVDAEPTSIKPTLGDYPPASNIGIDIPEATSSPNSTDNDDNADYSRTGFTDFLASPEGPLHDRETIQSPAATDKESAVAYATVLARYVASLNRENRTQEILALYSAEIKKYGDEQGLYEQLLQWLGQTNMVEEQLRVYQETLKKFPTTIWRDRLARWFIRQKRNQEFETLSRDLIAKLNDEETETYLHKFVDSGAGANAATFDANLYRSLYLAAHQRFPHNLGFVKGLLRLYSEHKEWPQWQALLAEYYFESPEIRDQFLSHLASHNELRSYFDKARAAREQTAAGSATALPYKLFHADGAVWLSQYEEAISDYRELNTLYPNTPGFSERLINCARSLGQHDRKFLEESAAAAHALADAVPASADFRTRAGELQAELGDYTRARAEWEKLIPLGRGLPDTYLDAATIYWDYFQYDEALRTIKTLRQQQHDETLYAFQTGVILEDKHELQAALAEYLNALGNNSESESGADIARAKKRLLSLSKRPGVYEQIALAFKQAPRRSDNWNFIVEYVDFLDAAKHWPSASALLRAEISRTDSQPFLRSARDLFAKKQESAGQIAALRRLVVVAPSQRLAISYRLQLAQTYEQLGQRNAAASVLHELLQKYPTNYGVLSETSDFYRRIGLRQNSLAVLQSGMQRGLGRFHYIFGRKLAAQQLEMNHAAAAERILTTLHNEDRLNTEVFHELARLYVRTGKRDALRQDFTATLDAIKQQDLDVKEIHAQVAELRSQMIEAFTRLKDYSAAVEQHIEIINRDPEDEEKVDAAINYVKRYGGGATLLDYYQRTAQQAYKNYRWNVVLARIYDAKGDLASAARQYHAALDNQPEMLELYESLSGIYTRSKDYDAALSALNKAAELSNEDPQYIKLRIDVLEKAGRHREAELERRKLPHEEPQQLSVAGQFAEAARMRGSERKRAIAAYREAFNAFEAEPFKHDLKAAEIAGYVQTVRDEEPLDQIMRRLWELRSRLAVEAGRANNPQAGKARALLEVIDGAAPEAVGGVAAEKATGDELSALFTFLKQHIEATTTNGGDQTATLACLQNLSRRAGFGSLEEQILVKQKDIAYSLHDAAAFHGRLQTLVDFYSDRGAYQQVIGILEGERLRDAGRDSFDYARLIADNARLLGDRERELQALREIYDRPVANPGSPSAPSASPDGLVTRYFEALEENGAAGRNELLSRAQQAGAQQATTQHANAAHQLQLINFLLRKGDKELAHTAIENTALPVAWKAARNAEASLALREFDSASEAYFRAALQPASIGELIKQHPDTTKQLVGDDWFHLSSTYGQWLYLSPDQQQKSKAYSQLPALVENRPQDVNEQAKLGRWYLEQKDAKHALEQIELAHEAQAWNKKISADLGSAFFLLGERDKAEVLWSQIIADEAASLDDYELYLETLSQHGFSAQARARLAPLLSKQLNSEDEDEDNSEPARKLEQLKTLIHALSASFAEKNGAEFKPLSATAETARAAFFRKLCESAPDNTFLPEFLIREKLVAPTEAAPFYRMLIARSSGLSSYDRDYAFVDQQAKGWEDAGMEEAVDHETNFKPSEPDSARINWQKEYLEYLLERNETAEARDLIATIEAGLKRRYARPVWLRLAGIRLELRAGRVASAYASLARLVGIETSESLTAVKPPSLERLSEASALLLSEGHEPEAQALTEAAYARQLALAQYTPSTFVGLADLAFRKGDAASGLKWLQAMVSLGKEELRAETEAELAALPLVKAHAVAGTAELPAISDDIELSQALRLAGDTAAEFGQFDAALAYRQELLTVSPDDEENRIELVRLLAANRKTNEAIENLAAIIGDRATTRRARWQAVWLAPEITEQKPELWSMLRDHVRQLNPGDSEMAAALQSLALSARHVNAGQVNADQQNPDELNEAVRLIITTESINPNPQLRFLRAILERNQGRDAASLSSFAGALIAGSDSSLWQAFSFSEAEPLEQIIRLYLKQNQPRAALKLSKRAAALQARETGETDQTGDSGEVETAPLTAPAALQKTYQTLAARAARRQEDSRAELLESLSAAAEQIGDLNQAIELEQVRLAFLTPAFERQTAQLRLDRLRELQRRAERESSPSLVIDQKLVGG
jgi:tetratricopeptide (TPR) repeat protein